MTSPSITIDLTPQGTMERLEWLAWFSDSALRIPGTSRSIGADGVLSMVPGVGTLVGTGMSLYVIGEAVRHGVPARLLTRVWVLTITLLALWSLVAWITHGLVGVAGGLVSSNADIIPADPLFIEWASWLASAGTGVGEWLVVAVWGLVSLVLLALGFVATKLVPKLNLPRARA